MTQGASSSTNCQCATAKPCSRSAPYSPRRHGLSLTRQAISQHLGVLESAGLVVTGERRGRSKFHYFDPEPLGEITARWPTRRGPNNEDRPDERVR